MPRLLQKDIAQHLDLSVSQIKTLVSDGILDQKNSLDEIRVAYIRHLRKYAHGRKKSDINRVSETDMEPGTIEYEKLRLTKAQADGVELKNQIARGEVAPIELIEKVLLASSAEAAGILDSLTLNIKRKHSNIPTQVLESIKEQVVKAQNAIAKSDKDLEPVLRDYVNSLAAG